MSTCIPFLEKCIPKEFLIPIALENSIHADEDMAVEVEEESQSITTEDDEAMLKESTSSSTSSASSSSISCFSPSLRRRGSLSYPNKNKKGTARAAAADRQSLTDSPRLDRPNRPFSNLKRII